MHITGQHMAWKVRSKDDPSIFLRELYMQLKNSEWKLAINSLCLIPADLIGKQLNLDVTFVQKPGFLIAILA